MYNGSENENIMQAMGNRNLDEMRQQTLDALKVVQSFEVKPARSVRVQELLAQKTHARDCSASAVKSGNARAPAMRARPIETSQRHVLQPVPEVVSPEKRFASSPVKVTSASNSPARSPLLGKSSRTREVSPVKSIFAKRLKQAPSSDAAEFPLSTSKELRQTQGLTRVPLQERAVSTTPKTDEDTLGVGQPMARNSTLARPSMQQSSQLARRGPLATSFRSVSRLLQPTAASAAKMRPVRAAMAPMRTERALFGDPKPWRSNTSLLSRPTTTAARPNTYASKPLLPPSSAASKPVAPASSGSSHPLRTGLSQLHTAHNQHLTAYSSEPELMPGSKPAPAAAGLNSGVSIDPSAKSLLSSVLTKTHNEKQPAANDQSSAKMLPGSPNPSDYALAHPSGLKPPVPVSEQSPAITSTPVRLTPNTSVTEHSSGSFHSFDFTNFSFEAEWANTPELRKKVLEQKNEDTLQLFGRMPPINLERIFGSEVKRQKN